jgi:hypothetical protein
VKQRAGWDVTKSDFFEQLLYKVRAVCGVLSGWPQWPQYLLRMRKPTSSRLRHVDGTATDPVRV